MRQFSWVFLAIFSCFAGSIAAAQSNGDAFVAGRYPLQSPATFGEPARSAQYVAMRDGTLLAINIYRPTTQINGAPVAVTAALPVVWVLTSSRRATIAADGTLSPSMSDGFDLVRRGFVFAVAEARGKGASFGTRRAIADLEEARDAFDITEWLARQPWSDGNIGMYGGASLGRTQLSAAFYRPPHLKALFVGFTEFDRYDGWHRGGIPDNPVSSFSKFTTAADTPPEDIARLQPVDGDEGRQQLRAAFDQHAGNVRYDAFFSAIPYRDSESAHTGDRYWQTTGISRHLKPFGAPGLALYHSGGWFADSRRDTLLMLRNLPNPQRAIIGPWNPASAKPEREAERLAFFDRYLKGIRNGIDQDPRIAYFTRNRAAGQEWRYADEWPVPHQKRTLFLSANNGLAGDRPAAQGADTQTARYDIRSLSQFEVRGEMDLSAADRDAKALTWTSETLREDLEVTGHPVARLWVSANVTDLDVFAHLEQVDAQGVSTYVTDGRLRASHRRTHRPYYDTAGLPWHRSERGDLQPLKPGVPAELTFDLLPTSIVFKAGSRIRIAISHADPAALFLRSDPAPTVTVHRSPKYPSRVELPVIRE